jgi:hypothetical protein
VRAKFGFQSLFSWNSPSDYTAHLNQRGIVHLYVSILVFVELALGQVLVKCNVRRNLVSILVFVELALGLVATVFCAAWDFLFQSLFSWNSPSDSADFSSFSSFLSVKPAFSYPPSGMNGIYWIPYKFIPVSRTCESTLRYKNALLRAIFAC